MLYGRVYDLFLFRNAKKKYCIESEKIAVSFVGFEAFYF